MINITKLKDVFKDKTIPDQDLLEAYRTLTIRFIDIEQRLRSLELNEVDLRNKVLRKIQIRDNSEIESSNKNRRFAI